MKPHLFFKHGFWWMTRDRGASVGALGASPAEAWRFFTKNFA